MLYISCGNTFWKAVQTSGLLLSDRNIDFIHGFDDIKKLQFWIHASPDNFMKTAAHTNPERQTLLVLRASSCIKQEDIVETLKYLTALNTISHRSSEKQKHPNAKRGKHKTKYCFHSPQATFCTNTRLWNVLLHLKTVHIAVPFNPNASFLFL